MEKSYYVPFYGDLISRNKQEIDIVVYSKSLSCYHYEEQAAKEFINYLEQHPEESKNDLHLRIDSVEHEEDHYGNGGGTERIMKIYKRREETDDELKARIAKEESEMIKRYKSSIKMLTNKLFWYMKIDKDTDKETFDEMGKRLVKEIVPVLTNENYPVYF